MARSGVYWSPLIQSIIAQCFLLRFLFRDWQMCCLVWVMLSETFPNFIKRRLCTREKRIQRGSKNKIQGRIQEEYHEELERTKNAKSLHNSWCLMLLSYFIRAQVFPKVKCMKKSAWLNNWNKILFIHDTKLVVRWNIRQLSRASKRTIVR